MVREYQPRVELDYTMGSAANFNRRAHPSKVPPGEYPRLWGVDGRYEGGMRRFPGFRQTLDLKAAPFAGGGFGAVSGYTHLPKIDNTGLDEVWFFKYLKVRVVSGGVEDVGAYTWPSVAERTLRGFVVGHPIYYDWDEDGVFGALGSAKEVLRFYYWDPKAGSWVYHDLLHQVTSAVSSKLNPFLGGYDKTHPLFPTRGYMTPQGVDATWECDVVSHGAFIYLAAYTPTLTFPLCIHRSIFVAGIGNVVEQNAHNMDTWLVTHFGPPPWPTHVEDIGGGAMESQYQGSGGVLNGDTVFTGRLIVGQKNVRGPMVPNAAGDLLEGTAATDDSFRLAARQASTERSNFIGSGYHWLNINSRCYRSFDSATFVELVPDLPEGGSTFLETNEALAPNISTSQPMFGSDHLRASGYGTVSHYTYASIVTEAASGLSEEYGRLTTFGMGTLADPVLAGKDVFIVFQQDTSFAPTVLRMFLPYQQTVLRVGSPPIPPATSLTNKGLVDVLSWGRLDDWGPEECRVRNSTTLGNGFDDGILALVGAGDFAFVVGEAGVYRIQRNGPYLAINDLQSLVGGVCRWGCLGVGTSLFYVSDNGLHQVDGATGEFLNVRAMERVILDDWRESLLYTRMAYDNKLAAVILVNTEEQEAILFWMNTGAVTQLKNVPFLWGTEGRDPEGDDNRSFWILGNGRILTPNGERVSGTAYTMCGGLSTALWNSTVLSVDGTTIQLNDWESEGKTLDDECVGFLAYNLRTGESQTISAVSTRDLTTALAFADVVIGDRIAVAPVWYEVVGSMVRNEGSPDIHNRRLVQGMRPGLWLLGGETTYSADPTALAGNPNLRLDCRVYGGSNLETPLASVEGGMSEVSDQNTVAWTPAIAGAILFPAWRCLAANVDFELLGSLVYAEMTASEEVSRHA